MIQEEPVLIRIDGEIAMVTLNRPQSLNALDLELLHGLSAAITSLHEHPTVRVVVLRANGPSFCAGGDLHTLARALDNVESVIGGLIDAANALILAMHRLPIPILASVQGAAAGGGFSLVAAADLIIAADSARFVLAYPKIAVPPDAGLSSVLIDRLGPWRAFDAMLFGDRFSANELHALGLVNKVVDGAALERETLHWAQRLAELPVQTVREVKRLVNQRLDESRAHQLSLERPAFLRCAKQSEFVRRVQTLVAQ